MAPESLLLHSSDGRQSYEMKRGKKPGIGNDYGKRAPRFSGARDQSSI